MFSNGQDSLRELLENPVRSDWKVSGETTGKVWGNGLKGIAQTRIVKEKGGVDGVEGGRIWIDAQFAEFREGFPASELLFVVFGNRCHNLCE